MTNVGGGPEGRSGPDEWFRPLIPPPSQALLRQQAIDEYLASRQLPDPARERRTRMLADFLNWFMITSAIGLMVAILVLVSLQH